MDKDFTEHAESKTLEKCVLCGVVGDHDWCCDRNPAKGQPIEYQLARVACAIPVPKGFGQDVDGTDGERVGANVASVEQWRQFFVTFLAQGVLHENNPDLTAEVRRLRAIEQRAKEIQSINGSCSIWYVLNG